MSVDPRPGQVLIDHRLTNGFELLGTKLIARQTCIESFQGAHRQLDAVPLRGLFCPVVTLGVIEVVQDQDCDREAVGIEPKRRTPTAGKVLRDQSVILQLAGLGPVGPEKVITTIDRDTGRSAGVPAVGRNENFLGLGMNTFPCTRVSGKVPTNSLGKCALPTVGR